MTVALKRVVPATPAQDLLERVTSQMIVLSYTMPERFGKKMLGVITPAVVENLRDQYHLLAEYAIEDLKANPFLFFPRMKEAALKEGVDLEDLMYDLCQEAKREEPEVLARMIGEANAEAINERINGSGNGRDKTAASEPLPAKAPDPQITVLENMRSRPVSDLLLDESLTTPEAVFEGLLALGEVTVLGGPPKAMKSWTVKAMGICAASGKPWLGFNAVRPFKVLLLSAEGREVRLRERFKQLIAFTPAEDEGLRLMEYVSTGGKLKIDTDAGEETLVRLAEPFEVVILDPYYRFIANGDENSHADQRRIQDVLDRVKSQGKCVLLVHHVRKSTGVNSGISELRGAGLDGYVDGAIMLTRKKAESTDEFTLDFMLRNFEDPNPMELSRQGVVLVPAMTTLRPRTNMTSREIVQILTDFGGEMRSEALYRQIQELKSCSKATAERAVAYASTPPDNPVSWKPVPGTARGRTYYPTEDPANGPVAVQGVLEPEKPKRRTKRSPK